MTNEEYIDLSGKTDCNYENILGRIFQMEEPDAMVLHGALGLATEAGEVLDALKKTLFYGKPFDLVNMKEELGDILWYFARLCKAFDFSFEDIQETNIAKLKARYGEKFSEEKAITRDLTAERTVLEA